VRQQPYNNNNNRPNEVNHKQEGGEAYFPIFDLDLDLRPLSYGTVVSKLVISQKSLLHSDHATIFDHLHERCQQKLNSISNPVRSDLFHLGLHETPRGSALTTEVSRVLDQLV